MPRLVPVHSPACFPYPLQIKPNQPHTQLWAWVGGWLLVMFVWEPLYRKISRDAILGKYPRVSKAIEASKCTLLGPLMGQVESWADNGNGARSRDQIRPTWGRNITLCSSFSGLGITIVNRSVLFAKRVWPRYQIFSGMSLSLAEHGNKSCGQMLSQCAFGWTSRCWRRDRLGCSWGLNNLATLSLLLMDTLIWTACYTSA